MFLKRTSPNLTLPLAGSGLEFGDQMLQEEIVLPTNLINQVVPCWTYDHKRNDPQFYLAPSHHKKRPEVIAETIEALKQTYKKAKRLTKLFYRKRRVASQRREAVINVLLVMMQFCDLETFEVGFYNDGGDFIRLDVAYIAQQAKMSIIRVNRAIRDLTQAGYLNSIRQYQTTEEGTKRGLPSIRTISKQLFIDLKIDHFRLIMAQDYKRKQNAKKLLKKRRKILSMISGAVKKSSSNHSPLRRAIALLEHAAKEVMGIINPRERQNE